MLPGLLLLHFLLLSFYATRLPGTVTYIAKVSSQLFKPPRCHFILTFAVSFTWLHYPTPSRFRFYFLPLSLLIFPHLLFSFALFFLSSSLFTFLHPFLPHFILSYLPSCSPSLLSPSLLFPRLPLLRYFNSVNFSYLPLPLISSSRKKWLEKPFFFSFFSLPGQISDLQVSGNPLFSAFSLAS